MHLKSLERSVKHTLCHWGSKKVAHLEDRRYFFLLTHFCFLSLFLGASEKFLSGGSVLFLTLLPFSKKTIPVWMKKIRVRRKSHFYQRQQQGTLKPWVLLTDALWRRRPATLLTLYLSCFLSFWSYKATVTAIGDCFPYIKCCLSLHEIAVRQINPLAHFWKRKTEFLLVAKWHTCNI